MGVQDSRHAQLPGESLCRHPEAFQSIDDDIKEQRVQSFLMGKHRVAQLSGQGESHHEVVYRQRFIDLSFKPVGGLMVLAGGTVSMTTGQWYRFDFL